MRFVLMGVVFLLPLTSRSAQPEAEATIQPDNIRADTPATDYALKRRVLALSQNHPRVLMRARALAAQLERSNAEDWRYPDPMIGVTWSNAPYKKDLRFIRDQTPMTGIEYRVSQAIPFPGRLSLSSDLADLDAQSARLELAIEKNQLTLEFLSQVLLVRQLHRTYEATLLYGDHTRFVADTARTRYSVGRGDLADVSRASLEASRYDERAVRLKGMLAGRLRNLRYYLDYRDYPDPDERDSNDDRANSNESEGRNANSNESEGRNADANNTEERIVNEHNIDERNPHEPDTNKSESDIPAGTETGDVNRNTIIPTEIALFTRQIERYINEIKSQEAFQAAAIPARSLQVGQQRIDQQRGITRQNLARMEYLPDFEVFASYRQREYVANDPAAGEDFYSFGISMRVPLWSALSGHNRMRSSEHSTRSAEIGADDVISRQQAQFESARLNYETLDRQLELFENSLLPRARQARDSARLSYETGRADITILIDAWNALYFLETEAIRLRVERDRAL
ncbi:MAG: TolC family protein, partial [Leptospiraceae bacterium]|nr:TolC family protein [Leptospiraceae bacterium]